MNYVQLTARASSIRSQSSCIFKFLISHHNKQFLISMLISWICHQEAALFRSTCTPRGKAVNKANLFQYWNTYLCFSDIFFQVNKLARALTLMTRPMTRLLQVIWILLTVLLITKDLFSLHCHAFLIVSVIRIWYCLWSN